MFIWLYLGLILTIANIVTCTESKVVGMAKRGRKQKKGEKKGEEKKE